MSYVAFSKGWIQAKNRTHTTANPRATNPRRAKNGMRVFELGGRGQDTKSRKRGWGSSTCKARMLYRKHHECPNRKPHITRSRNVNHKRTWAVVDRLAMDGWVQSNENGPGLERDGNHQRSSHVKITPKMGVVAFAENTASRFA